MLAHHQPVASLSPSHHQPRSEPTSCDVECQTVYNSWTLQPSGLWQGQSTVDSSAHAATYAAGGGSAPYPCGGSAPHPQTTVDSSTLAATYAAGGGSAPYPRGGSAPHPHWGSAPNPRGGSTPHNYGIAASSTPTPTVPTQRLPQLTVAMIGDSSLGYKTSQGSVVAADVPR